VVKNIVSSVENKTQPPQLKSGCDGGKVASSHVVQLCCATPDALIYYTTDGMAPYLHSTKIKVSLGAFKSNPTTKISKLNLRLFLHTRILFYADTE